MGKKYGYRSAGGNFLTTWPLNRQMVAEERCEMGSSSVHHMHFFLWSNVETHPIQYRRRDFDAAWWVIAIREFAKQQQQPPASNAGKINTCL